MLSKYDRLYALAFEEIIIQNQKFSVGASLLLTEIIFGQFKVILNSIEARNNDNARQEFLKQLILRIKTEFNYNKYLKIAIIIDEDVNILSKYNTHRYPILDKFYLPKNFKLISSNDNDEIVKELFHQANLEAQNKIIELQNRENQVIKNWDNNKNIYTHIRYVNKDDKTNDQSPLSLKLHYITGFYLNDYIKPVIKEGGDIINIISDESVFKDHICVSLIAFPYQKMEFYEKIDKELKKLVVKYGLKSIHFTEIFGKERILGQNRDDFLDEYTKIVVQIGQSSCLSISKNKQTIIKEHGIANSSYEEIFFNLFWNNFIRLALLVNDYSIFHIFTEQEDDYIYETAIDNAKKQFEKLYSGIDQTLNNIKPKYLSICKHPHIFTKKALLFSSLADLVAYTSNKVQNKIDSNIPPQKIIKEYGLLLKLIKNIFSNYSGLASKEFVELINSV